MPSPALALLLLIPAFLIPQAPAARAVPAGEPRPPSAQGAQPAASPLAPVEYTVDLRNARSQMVDMTVTFRALEPGAFEVALPVWRPGKYQVLDPAGGIRDVVARSANGRPLLLNRKNKSAWTVEIPPFGGGENDLVITYRVYANSIADRTRHADDTHAFLSPSTVFLYAPALRSRPLRVKIETPGGGGEAWKVATGLSRDPADGGVFVAPSYDVLVDSPLEIGEHEVLTFEVEGAPHEVVIWNPTGQGRTLDAARITGDFEKIVREQLAIFGTLPYERYTFLIHAYPGGCGGTEHLNSTIMGCRPGALREDAAFRKFLGLVSHEFFHTWNVKQFRPAGIHPYDYQRENYTDLLWVAEGTTSYYDDLTLARAGLMKPDDYLKALSGTIDSVRKRPGARVQSLADSSFDAWTKFNRSTPDSVNSTVSFYDKGALVSFLLDMEIRRGSGGEDTLDDVMREMYRAFPLAGPGYTHEQFAAIAARFAGHDLRGFFAAAVFGTGDLPFEEAAAVVGLELTRGDPESKPKAYIGLDLDAAGAVTAALSDGPAYAGGLVPGDTIVAANGQRIRSGADLNGIVDDLDPGDELRLTYFRYDTLREAILILGERAEGRWTLRRVKDPTDAQREAYRAWIGQDWPGTKKDDEPAGPSAGKEDKP